MILKLEADEPLPMFLSVTIRDQHICPKMLEKYDVYPNYLAVYYVYTVQYSIYTVHYTIPTVHKIVLLGIWM